MHVLTIYIKVKWNVKLRNLEAFVSPATLDQSGHPTKACIKFQNDYLDQKIAFITYSVWLQFGPKSVWTPEQTVYLFCIYQWL